MPIQSQHDDPDVQQVLDLARRSGLAYTVNTNGEIILVGNGRDLMHFCGAIVAFAIAPPPSPN